MSINRYQEGVPCCFNYLITKDLGIEKHLA